VAEQFHLSHPQVAALAQISVRTARAALIEGRAPVQVASQRRLAKFLEHNSGAKSIGDLRITP